MSYAIQYYSEDVQEDVLGLPHTLLARYFSLTNRMQIFGPNLGEPHTKAFRNGLFELRMKDAEGIARIFYCTLVKQQIVMLHCFIKKSNKTPLNDQRIAEKRLKEVKNAGT